VIIQDFSHVAKPLHKLNRKGKVWRCTKYKWKAFEELKQLITSTPILVQPNQDMQFPTGTDASG